MTALHLPWLQLAVFLPVLVAVWVRSLRDPDTARWHCLIACSFTLFCTLAAWLDFISFHEVEVTDRWDILASLAGENIFSIDALSAPLLPLVSLLYFLTVLATLRTKLGRFSFASLLVSQSILLATLSSKQPWVIVALLAAGTIPPWFELRARRKPTRIYVLHMSLFVGLLVSGLWLLETGEDSLQPSLVAVVLLMAAALIRSGIIPMHCWMTDLFENASFGNALLFVTPMVGVYTAMRLVLPIAPEWVLHASALLSLVTAIYAAGMALVQQEARRFFCFLFLSYSSLVFVGLETGNAIGLTGALCVWFSVGLSMTGFGLTLRSIEARAGRLSLEKFHGLHDITPRLAGLFLLTGLASIGFPGTVGFVGTELLVDGAVQTYPLVGIAIVIAAALNGLAVLHIFFRVFAGTHHVTAIDLRSRPVERFAVLLLTALILGGGLYPQPGVASRYGVAQQIVKHREQRFSVVTSHSRSKQAILQEGLAGP